MQVLQADAENCQKDGKGFLKMDKTNIGLVREDLEEDFYAVAYGHTKAITALLEEFNDNPIVLRIEAEQAMDITPLDVDTVPCALEIGTTLPEQNEPRDEGSSAAPEPEFDTAPTEGILHILTDD